MSVTVLRRTDGDLTRRYWWVVLLLVLAAGGGALLLMRGGPGGGGPTGELAGSSSDQSLDSIDQGLRTVGAPGQPLNLSMDGAGAYKRKDDPLAGQKSGLYEAPTTALNAGAPVSVSQAGSAAAEGSLAAALKKVASSTPAKGGNKGWGGASVRTGFTPPKATFGSMGSSSGGGGGGSGASLGVSGGSGGTPFGISGSNPGSASTMGGVGGGASKLQKGGYNQAFSNLKQVENVASKAGGAGGDLGSNLGARSFDGGAQRVGLQSGNAADSGASVASGVPENLKLDDPNLQKKQIDVPGITKEKDAGNKDQLERQIMMMLLTAAIGGIAGPMFGAIGVGMTNALMGTDMKMNYNYNAGNSATSSTCAKPPC